MMDGWPRIEHIRGASFRYIATFPPEVPVGTLTLDSRVRTPGGQRIATIATQPGAGNTIEFTCAAASTAGWPVEALHWLTAVQQPSGDVQIFRLWIDVARGLA